MPHSLYDATIRYIISILRSLDHCLEVAEQDRPDTQTLTTARLIDDMKPLSYQIHQATRISDRLLAVMLGNTFAELPKHEDNLTTFRDFHGRIGMVLANLSVAKPEDINKSGELMSGIVMGPTNKDQLSGAANAFGAALPNITFHANIAYAILRKEGISLGKKDYISSFASEYC